eukprot:m51a1_g1161 hypothetical protein (861) ;mRNA; r:330037-333715
MRGLVATVLLAACTLGQLQPGSGVFRLYYQSSWSAPRIHYNANGAGWTTAPGVPMIRSDNSSWPSSSSWWMTTIAANKVTFVLNDGSNSWDNNGNKNYVVSQPGVYTLKAFSGSLSSVETFSKGCPMDCSGHGHCQTTGRCAARYTCQCDNGYSGAACTCAPGTCGAHGQCDAQGACVCVSPFVTCNGTKCGTDTTSDINNCGGCGKTCSASGAGVKGVACQSSACKVLCQDGWTACPDALSASGTTCVRGTDCPSPAVLPGCQTFTDNRCQGDQIDVDPKYAANMWYTPQPGDADYQESFGDYWRLVGHAHLVYDASRTSVQVTIVAQHRDSGVTLTYEFDGAAQSSNTKTYTAAAAGPAIVRVLGSDGAVLRLADIDFQWSAPKVDRTDGDFRGGQKGAIVELFGWPHKEIEAECQSLAAMGWAGVKVFPMQEQVMSLQPFNGIMNPWYFMYQPVSYRFEGRMGTHADLRRMIYTCRKYGVRVYADAVINHMVGSGNDINPHHRNSRGGCTYWPNKNSSADQMSPFYSQGFTYTYNQHTGKNPLQEFPAVPYGPLDFHCERELNSWSSPLILNAGWLTGLTDLHTGRDNVRERIADYLTSILSIGFSGFRIDAAKHIQPDDLVAILSKLRRNMGGSMPTDWITWLEVLLGGEADLLLCNTDSGYNYGAGLENKLRAAGWSEADILKVKIWHSGYPKEPQVDCGKISKRREAIQNDDADQQNPGSSSRDMAGEGSVFIKERDVAAHRGFEVKLFSNPNGAADNDNDYPVRLVLSSFFWGDNGAGQGIPDGKSDCSLCKYTCDGCHGMPYTKASDPNSCGYDMTVYTRTHRDKAVVLAMRRWMKMSTSVSNADLGLPSKC